MEHTKNLLRYSVNVFVCFSWLRVIKMYRKLITKNIMALRMEDYYG